VEPDPNWPKLTADDYSYANTSRTVSREAFRAGRKLARALRITTKTSQSKTPAIE
jgi:hypothetical protein